MSIVVILPSIHPLYTRACLASLDPKLVDVSRLQPPTNQRDPEIRIINGEQWENGKPRLRLAVVWNTPEHNLGVAASWNVGIRDVLDGGHDWLTILSAGVRFGPTGGRDFFNRLDEFQSVQPDVLGVEGANDLGWHLLAFPRHVLETVGEFDAEQFPSYWEDNDYSVRIQRAYNRNTKDPDFQGPLWPKIEVDAHLESVAHGIKLGGISVNFASLKRRFERKWGEHEEYATPYDDPSLDWAYTGLAPLEGMTW